MDISEEEKKEADFCIECEVNPEFAKELSKMLGIDFKENETIINTNILLNLIEKQQKEIEDIYRLNGKLDDENNRLRKEIKEYISENYIPKEAIREKIRKIESETWYISDSIEAKNSCIEELEDLLGE